MKSNDADVLPEKSTPNAPERELPVNIDASTPKFSCIRHENGFAGQRYTYGLKRIVVADEPYIPAEQ